MNDVFKRTLSTLGVTCHHEPSGISRLDGKRPNGLTLAPWKNGKALLWDFTCPDALAPSYLTMSAADTRSVADSAEKKIWMKYANLVTSYLFTPITIKMPGAFGIEAKRFFKDVGLPPN